VSVNSWVVYLFEVESSQLVEAELRDAILEDQLEDWENHWQPELWSAMLRLKAQGVWPVKQESAHWNWQDKIQSIRSLLAYRTFCITCGGMTQGMMQVDLTKSARIESQKGKPIVYIDYLENAPWNRPTLNNPARYRNVGTLLIRAAIELSRAEGFKGRIGLHSLPQSNNFYASKCGMTDLGPDSDCQNLRYFEMTIDQARSFLEVPKE